jgi:HK97 family phage portal protein
MAGLKGVLQWVWEGRPDTGAVRSGLQNPEEWMLEAFGARKTSSGVSVSADSAMRLSAVSACVRLISESIASLPLNVFRRVDAKRRERVSDVPAYRLLHAEPNRLMTSFVFRDTMTAAVLLDGNAYAVIARDGGGNARELLPVPVGTSVRVLRTPGGELAYSFLLDERQFLVGQWDMLHVPGLAFNGISGMSPIRYAAESVGLGIAAEQYGGSFFGNGSVPSGFITLPGKLSPEQSQSLRNSWYAAYGGLLNANRTAVLFEGAKFEKISIPPDEAQFIETRKFQVSEIARWYRVPPHMIGDLEKSTNNNIEHQSLEFVTHTLRPWLVRFEQEFNRKLFPVSSDGVPSDLYCEFNVDGLLRGDIKSRTAYYQAARQWGWMSVNDIRAIENMEPVADGDIYLSPLNMQPLGAQLAADPADDSAGDQGGAGNSQNEEQQQ